MFTNILVFFSLRSLIKILVGDCFNKRVLKPFSQVIPGPKHQDHTFALGGSRLGSSRLEDEDHQEDLGILVLV